MKNSSKGFQHKLFNFRDHSLILNFLYIWVWMWKLDITLVKSAWQIRLRQVVPGHTVPVCPWNNGPGWTFPWVAKLLCCRSRKYLVFTNHKGNMALCCTYKTWGFTNFSVFWLVQQLVDSTLNFLPVAHSKLEIGNVIQSLITLWWSRNKIIPGCGVDSGGSDQMLVFY